MIPSIFEGSALLFLSLLAFGSSVIGSLVGKFKFQEDYRALWRGLEAAALTIVGGLLARTFISVLLIWADDLPSAGLMVGWVFFLWVGAIDTIAWFFDTQLLTNPTALLWIGTGVGAFIGAMDGIWKIHNWRGLGWLSFPLDVTWGLAGTTNACLLHLVNFSWAGHAIEERTGAHRYTSGFRIKGDFAFTQGSVMSNLKEKPTSKLGKHELTHVWQNRGFGPLYAPTYLAWMVAWFFPGLLAGLIIKAGVGQGIEKWCYFNCPWEAWGYAVQGQNRNDFESTTGKYSLIWPGLVVSLLAIPFFGVVLFLYSVLAMKIW